MPFTMARILLLFALMFVAPRISVRHTNRPKVGTEAPAHPVAAKQSRWAVATSYGVPLAVTVLLATYFTWPRLRH
jgi:hypothetical protein